MGNGISVELLVLLSTARAPAQRVLLLLEPHLASDAAARDASIRCCSVAEPWHGAST